MFGRYKKWLLWGGVFGAVAGIALNMMEKQKEKAAPPKYRLVRKMASKTLSGLRASLGEKKKWE